MWKHSFTMELLFSKEQMDIIIDSYMRQTDFDGTVQDFIETLANVGVCTTLLEMAKNL